MDTEKSSTKKMIALRPSHRKAAEAAIDAHTGHFRRSLLSDAIYPLTTPRSHPTADKLADIVLKEMAKAGSIQRHGHQHWIKVSTSRRLKSGRTVPESAEIRSLPLNTRCPGKWVSVDLESGEVWVGSEKGWNRAPRDVEQEVLQILQRRKG